MFYMLVKLTTLSSFQRTIMRDMFSQNQAKRLLAVVRFFLHRKEVIHPHVLVGIPCYDFTPVTCPTLGGPLPYGLGYRLQVLQTPMA